MVVKRSGCITATGALLRCSHWLTSLGFVSGFVFSTVSLEPPDFDIVGSTNHINVIVKFPPVIPKILNGKILQYYLPLVIEEQSGKIVKKVSG